MMEKDKSGRYTQAILVPLSMYLESGVEVAKVPTHIQVAMLGEWKTHPFGPFSVTEKETAEIIANFERIVLEPVIDEEHSSLYTPENSPACGWMKKLYNKGLAGIWADVEWTALGERLLASKEKRYISPVLSMNWKDPETGKNLGCKLDSAGLTNRPYLENLPPIVNSKDSQTQEKEMEFLEEMAIALGLKPKATKDEVLAAMSKLADDNKAQKAFAVEILKALGLGEDAKVADVTAKVAAMSKTTPDPKANTELQAALTRIDTLEKEAHEKDKREFIGSGIACGKITAATRENWETLYDGSAELAKISLGVAPQLVPLSKVGQLPEPEKGPVLDDAQKAVNAQLGLSDEDFKKHAK